MVNPRSATAILFACLVIVMLGFGIALPLMAFFITHYGASVSAMGLMMSLYSIMQFIFAPMWGQLSDRIGRRPVLLIGIAGFGFAFLLQAFAPTIVLFIAARVIAGILSSATMPTAMAYVADITSKENRSRGVGLMGAAMGLGMIFGPMLGGLLSNLHFTFPAFMQSWLQVTTDAETGALINLSVPFLFSSLLAFITVILVFFFLPESLKKVHQRQEPAATGRRLSQLRQALSGKSGFLFAVAFLLAFALANFEGVLPLYGKQQFMMNPSDLGLLMGGMGLVSVIEQGILIHPLTRRFGEARLLLGGLVISMLGLLGIALVQAHWGMILFALVFSSGNVLLQPSVTSLISQRASPAEQGSVMGYNNSFQSLGRGVGPLWAGIAFDIYPTLSFWTGAVIQMVTFLYGVRVLRGLISSHAAPQPKPEQPA